ncbi:MAG: hypothetical protein WCS87_02860 [Methylococcaceae bacterium]
MRFYILFLLFSVAVLAEEVSLTVPSDPKAQYFILEQGVVSAQQKTIVTKRIGSNSIIFSKRAYD